MMSIVEFMKESVNMPSGYEDLLNHFLSSTELDSIIRDIVKTETINKIEDK
jgi:hypothetical protein